jgi:diguanylate cyclase (GGDEF)-like protein/PAS domain S-box-containing protein
MIGCQDNQLILKEFYRILMDSSTVWLNILDKHARVVEWNKAAEIISGYSKDEVIGADGIWKMLYPDEGYRNSIYLRALDIINNRDLIVDFETTIQRKDGSSRVVLWNSHDIKDEEDNVIGSLALGRDVTELHNSTKKLRALTEELERSNQSLRLLSEEDELTGLYNRRVLEMMLKGEWERHMRSQAPLSLLYIDIDRFKQYNDTYGHHKGDDALIEVAQIFKANARRAIDKVFRFGGEEFALLLPETDYIQATAIARKLCSDVAQRKIKHNGSNIHKFLTVSVGVATVIPTLSDAVDSIRHEADRALYKAKKNGRNRVE